MRAHLTPGTYRRPQSGARGQIALVRTDVAGFVGFTERGPLRDGGPPPPDPSELAVRLESWAEFQQIFGGPIPFGYLAYAARAFFANGGRRCYVVRVAATSAPDGTVAAIDASERPAPASLPLPRPSSSAVSFGLATGTSHGVGSTVLTLVGATGITAGTLVGIVDEGFREFSVVVAAGDDGVVRLAKPLSVALSDSARVVVYDPAIVITAASPVVVNGERASSPGSWGNRIRLDVGPLPPDAREFSLRVTVEPGLDTSRPADEEFYRRVSLDPLSPYFAPGVINEYSRLIAVRVDVNSPDLRLDLTDGPLAGPPSSKVGSGGVTGAPSGVRSVRLMGGRDGVSRVRAADFTGGPDDLRGLRLLEEVDEVAILACPDSAFTVLEPVQVSRGSPTDPVPADPTAVPPVDGMADVQIAVTRALLDQCERLRDRVAVIDPPDRLALPVANERAASPARLRLGASLVPPPAPAFGTVTGWRAQFDSPFGALYYPWLKVSDPLGIEGAARRVPPSGHVAGVYAQTDTLFGVQRPPANVELDDIVDVAADVSATQQELLNPNGVNALRSFPGRGVRVWGARSLEGSDDRWRFIHVRRLMSMIEKSVDLSSQWAVFEPNDFALRSTLAHSLTAFLDAIWRKGGLEGAVPAEGFYVKCDETNNPTEVVDAGQIVCRVGVAPVAPAEFIIFEIRQTVDGVQVVES